MKNILPFILCLFLLSFAGCSNIKYLKEGQKLYTGVSVKIIDENGKRPAKDLEPIFETRIRPRPNNTFLNKFRIKLWYYNIAGEPKNKRGFRYWLKHQVGEPPVLFSSVDPHATSELLEQNVESKGFFRSTSEFKLKQKRKTVFVEYTLKVKNRYLINDVKFMRDTGKVNEAIRSTAAQTLLKKSAFYDLDIMKNERIRIDSLLKTHGYYFFNPDYLLFKVDSLKGNSTVDITITLKKEIPLQAYNKYRVNNIFIHPSYSLADELLIIKHDTLLINGYHYITTDKKFDPEAIIRSVALQQNKLYSSRDHDMTLSRLTSMGVFKFVNIRFKETDTISHNKLDCFIYLTPLSNRALRLELQAISKSNDLAGPAVITSYLNRNVFKGAERLTLNLNAGYESQLSQRSGALSSYKVGAEGRLTFPKFITPFKIKEESFYYIPQTNFVAGVDMVNRVQLFRMNSIKFTYGYLWRESEIKLHELNPVSINYVNLGNTTGRFEELLSRNLLLRKSFEEQFIVGSTYSYIFNSQLKKEKLCQIYFNGNIDLAGNTLSLLQQSKKNSNSENSWFSGTFSQYAKFDTDFRYYYRTGKHSKIATRLIAGLGIPYGNSETLPYIKQFFSGGSNSIRAFPARSVGPGNYSPTFEELSFFEQGGDIKLESSIEFRFDITRMIKGAVFTDAGNVWLLKPNSQVPNGEFSAGSIIDQIAIGAGVGLRFDASYFVLRTDLAFPLIDPHETRYLSGRNGSNTFSITNKGILNVAIGYPF